MPGEIVKGAVGEQGPEGQKGDKGDTGAKGETGPQVKSQRTFSFEIGNHVNSLPKGYNRRHWTERGPRREGLPET